MKNNSIPTIRTPEDVVDVIPCLLGFHPTDSIVAIQIRGGEVALTARWDLACAQGESGVDRVCDELAGIADIHPAEQTSFIVVVYAEHDLGREIASGVWDGLGCAHVLDALVVDRDRWWFADQPSDSPGHRIAGPGRLSRALGGSVAASRADLAASIAAPKGSDEDEMTQTLVDAIESSWDEDPFTVGRQVVSLMDGWCTGESLTDQDFLAAGAAMSVGTARDQLWKVLTTSKAVACLPFWKEVLIRTPYPMRSAVLGVTAMVAWVAGEGALMNICIEEAEKTDPDYPLVSLVKQISMACLTPASWEEIRAEVV